MPKIIVRIKKKGADAGLTTIETEGFSGDSCMTRTANLKAALGGEKDETLELKPEYYDVQEICEGSEEIL